MGQALGDLLPLAVGIAISPMPIIAAILMLLSRNAARSSTGFLAGWVAGIVVVTVVVFVLVGQAGKQSDGAPSTASSVLKLIFGILLLLLAGKQWQSRPKAGEAATMPRWMSAIDSFTFVKALGLGLALSALNPKNLVMAVGAGTTIGGAQLSVGGEVVATLVFTLIAVSSVAIPVVAYLVDRSRVEPGLKSLHVWLEEHNAAMMTVVLLVIGAVMLGKGVAGLSA
jgi:threonine/homoserine/homoserine lactone efflux protein